MPCRATDSTGIEVRGEGCAGIVAPYGARKPAARHARKHGGARRRVWREVRLAIDEATMEVRAVEVTDSSVGDAPMLLGLLSQIPGGEPIASVTAPLGIMLRMTLPGSGRRL